MPVKTQATKRQPAFKYVVVVVVETNEKVTKKVLKERIEEELDNFDFYSDSVSRAIQRFRVRSVDLD